jgi:hypothetical protein
MPFKIDWRGATPQVGHSPIVIVFGSTDTVPQPHKGRIFNARNGLQACFAAFVWAWQRGPAVLLYPPSTPPVPAPWGGMLTRLTMGCGAGILALQDAALPAWLPTPYPASQSPTDSRSTASTAPFSEYLAPTWCMPAPAGCLGAHPQRGGVSLVISDKLSAKSARLPDWPFISLNDSGCAYWLADQMHGLEERVCWINAVTPDGELKPLDYLKSFDWKRVITLGNTATRIGFELGFDIQRMHHPMYWSFHRDKPYRLPEVIRDE